MKLVCPFCRQRIEHEDNHIACVSCNRKYPIVNSIPDFRQDDEYWCNVSRQKMRLLNERAEVTNDWVSAAESIIPHYVEHFKSFNRADTQFLFPITKNARILDAGSMWGGLTLPVAQYAREVVALDKTLETLSFLNIRATQMGYDNIYPIASTLDKLPFENNYFDLVILNGVLEWVAFRQDLILERHWNHRHGFVQKYAKDPTGMQIEVLEELRRVTKPQGYLFMAIENRFGYQYLTGYPDDHVNVRFVSFLPRRLADIITRLKRGYSYRTYIYSSNGCRNILLKSGYKNIKLYGAFAHYISPYAVIPFSLLKQCKKLVLAGGGKRLNLFFKLLPSFLIKYFSPSFIAIAGKDTSSMAEPRIISMIKTIDIMKNKQDELEPVLISRRADFDTPLKCFIYDTHKGIPVMFCKISRAKTAAGALKAEADNLSYIHKLLKDTPLVKKIPDLFYFGEVDDVCILVTDFLANDFYAIDNKPAHLLDSAVKASIDFLIEFQDRSATREVEAGEYLALRLTRQKDLIAHKLSGSLKTRIDDLINDLRRLKGTKLKLSAVHGDFDFYHNIFFNGKTVAVVDFEHFEKEGIPFLDLIMLVFHPFLIKLRNKKVKESFGAFLERNKALPFINGWLRYYSLKSGIDRSLFCHAVKIAALEQNAKEYPSYRDPASFPLYDIEIMNQLFNMDFLSPSL